MPSFWAGHLDLSTGNLKLFEWKKSKENFSFFKEGRDFLKNYICLQYTDQQPREIQIHHSENENDYEATIEFINIHYKYVGYYTCQTKASLDTENFSKPNTNQASLPFYLFVDGKFSLRKTILEFIFYFIYRWISTIS